MEILVIASVLTFANIGAVSAINVHDERFADAQPVPFEPGQVTDVDQHREDPLMAAIKRMKRELGLI